MADDEAADRTDESATPAEGHGDGEVERTGSSALPAAGLTDETGTGPVDDADGVAPSAADTGDRELVEIGAATTAGRTGPASRPTARSASTDLRKKDKASAMRDSGPAKEPRTGPVKFVRESVGELRKVVYPTGQQLVNYFVVVLVFVLFVIAYVSLLDLGFGAAMFEIFG